MTMNSDYWDQSDLFHWMSSRAFEEFIYDLNPAPGAVTSLYAATHEMMTIQGVGTSDEPDAIRGPRLEDLEVWA